MLVSVKLSAAATKELDALAKETGVSQDEIVTQWLERKARERAKDLSAGKLNIDKNDATVRAWLCSAAIADIETAYFRAHGKTIPVRTRNAALNLKDHRGQLVRLSALPKCGRETVRELHLAYHHRPTP